MFGRITIFLIGFGLMVIGFADIIMYSNLMTIGYNFTEYVHFIISKFECWYSIIGLFIIILTIYIPRRKENE